MTDMPATRDACQRVALQGLIGQETRATRRALPRYSLIGGVARSAPPSPVVQTATSSATGASSAEDLTEGNGHD